MRNFVFAALFVFVLAFAPGAGSPSAEAAGGGLGSNCYYKSTCAGQPLKCCVWFGTEYCFPADEIQCPQVYDC